MKNKLACGSILLLALFTVSCSSTKTASDYKASLSVYEHEVSPLEFKDRLDILKKNYIGGDYSLNISKLSKSKSRTNDGGAIKNGVSETMVFKSILADYTSKIIREENKTTSKEKINGQGIKKDAHDEGSFIRQYQSGDNGYEILYENPKAYYELNSSWEDLEIASNPLGILSDFYIASDDDLSYQYYIDGENKNILTLKFNYYATEANSLKNEGIKQISFLDNEIKALAISEANRMRIDNYNFKINIEESDSALYELKYLKQSLNAIPKEGYKESSFIDFGYIDFWRLV